MPISSSASSIPFDNTDTGLVSGNLQEAVIEVKQDTTSQLNTKQNLVLNETVDSTSTGSLIVLPAPTTPIYRLNSPGLVSFAGIGVPTGISELIIINSTTNIIVYTCGGYTPTSIVMGDNITGELLPRSSIKLVYSIAMEKWVVLGTELHTYDFILSSGNQAIYGSKQFKNNTYFEGEGSGVSAEFTNETWFYNGIRLIDTASTWNYVRLQQNPTQPADYNLTLPPTTGLANQVLKTDGTGVLDWVTPTTGGLAESDVINLIRSENVFANYKTQEVDDAGATTYIGQVKTTGAWLLTKIVESGNDTVITYANLSGNPTKTTFALAWTDRTTVTYNLISNLTGL